MITMTVCLQDAAALTQYKYVNGLQAPHLEQTEQVLICSSLFYSDIRCS